ncbi:pyridoxamine 5'-phosphate oxidase family protein [Microvirga makkahensis]|uniref:Pyridoxamine 5'-phosphate oxidase putative domain-containing protein n=1 Tax=Microvirga makkahensis TaxID=1128670 RepID=A0A7X3MT95_9HYPH|nr:pyridoxamine 5'-phosphate oxidase family protein [Microvirga makkahensis]MXQ12833.1 hypothetical protein [Microvirga makkahensis]
MLGWKGASIVLIHEEFAAFMASPVMIVLGTRDGSLVPEIARAVGAVVHREEGRIDLMISEWQWPRTVLNVRANGQLAVTFARPSDYVSYQVKGQATVAPVSAEHITLAAGYRKSMCAALGELGLERRIVAPWLINRDLVALRLTVEEIFVQTPGAKAGQLVERQP